MRKPIVITFLPAEGDEWPPVRIRLKRLLKLAWKSFGFRNAGVDGDDLQDDSNKKENVDESVD